MCIVWTENVCWITFPKGLKFLPFDVVASTSRKLMRIFQSFIFYVNRLNLSNPMMRRLKARMTFLHEFSNLHFCHKKWKIDIYFLRNSYFYRVARENLYTFKMAAILRVSTLQRCVIRGWNGNFVGFSGIFSKIVKNVPMKHYLHFPGKSQNRPRLTWNLSWKFEAI